MQELQALSPYAYGLYLLIILGGSLAAALCKNLIRAMAGLITAMLGAAGMYMMLNAPFVAMMQVLIYVGAVSVLIFFAIMLTKTPAGDSPELGSSSKIAAGLVVGVMPFVFLVSACLNYFKQQVETPPDIPVDQLGQDLLTRYALGFELISVVLFVAMAGAVILGFERRRSQ
ncbi:MAG: NADH-quinone oxidoreductase subunit [Desulfovibrionales bacterium]|jgi:NADH-quinone oxidoreductase subunit J|nr:NADH-quinone oxidoreductase subunit [Desulfovibrionales bacterium]